jgi:hypothetical protein
VVWLVGHSSHFFFLKLSVKIFYWYYSMWAACRHNDHGSMTALCGGMFFNDEGEQVDNTDPAAGLYIHTRKGKTVKATFPADCIGFQIGGILPLFIFSFASCILILVIVCFFCFVTETAQVHSGGALQATPHCVMGGKASPISRESFAVFMEPSESPFAFFLLCLFPPHSSCLIADWDEPMCVPKDVSADNVRMGSKIEYLPQGVPLLERRWAPDATFAEFTDKTLRSYYEY